jgi:hypothetical protein
MHRRTFLTLTLAAAAGPALAVQKPYRAPRTAYGAPELEGLWTNATYTELQRPEGLKGPTATPAEAQAWEARLSKTGGVNIPPAADRLGQAQSEFPETGSGLSRIRGEIRTSHIVDPPDGQIPWTEAAKRDLRIGQHGGRGYDNPEDRPHNERCLAAASTGAPILSSEDANVLQILQTRDHVVVLTEKYHDARIIRLPDAPARRGPQSWLGDSTGRWEGETLTAVTEGFPPGVIEHGDDLYLSGQSRVEERFTRISAGEILYEFTVADPYLFARPWRGEMVFRASPGAIFEYACHEGNYSLTNILAAARLGRQPERKPAPTQTAGP